MGQTKEDSDWAGHEDFLKQPSNCYGDVKVGGFDVDFNAIERVYMRKRVPRVSKLQATESWRFTYPKRSIIIKSIQSSGETVDHFEPLLFVELRLEPATRLWIRKLCLTPPWQRQERRTPIWG